MRICSRCGTAFPDDTAFCVADGTPLRKLLDPLLGKTIAQRYRLISRLGAGTMSSVYLARHVMIDRLSAIKVLKSELGRDADVRTRFLREARAVNRINHENIVEITDFGESAGLVYLVMEYVPGESLARNLAEAPLSWRRLVPIAVQIAAALGRAHQVGVVHRDLKPDHVLLVKRKDGTETVKITDFGISRVTDAPASTASGYAVGTPGYVAPECLEGHKGDARADLYALGALCYEALTGKLPYDAGSADELLHKARTEPPVPLRARMPGVPERVARVVMHLLARQPDDRPRDAFVAHDDLLGCLDAETHRGPPRHEFTPAPAGVGVYALAGSPDAASPSAPAAPRSTPRPQLELETRPYAELAPLCRAGWLRIERALERFQSLAEDTQAAVTEARRLVEAVDDVAERVRADQRIIEALEADGRSFKADFGRALDELGREASTAGGHIEETTARLASARASSGATTRALGEVESWNEIALDEERARAQSAAHGVAGQIDQLRGRLTEKSEELDRQIADVRARLEGHVAALRRLAAEAWIAIDATAATLGVRAGVTTPPQG